MIQSDLESLGDDQLVELFLKKGKSFLKLIPLVEKMQDLAREQWLEVARSREEERDYKSQPRVYFGMTKETLREMSREQLLANCTTLCLMEDCYRERMISALRSAQEAATLREVDGDINEDLISLIMKVGRLDIY
jgi:hypothetical protein